TMFYSATMAPEIERITKTFLKDPAKIEVARQATTSTTITQALIQLTPARKDRSFGDKRAMLRALIKAEGEACTNAIIFCNRKMDVDVVAKSLKSHGFNAAPIHGDLDQSQRMKTLDAFRDGTLHLLVASDVAARGLDIPAVSHVFNFDVPSHPEDYVHRIGRTGRAGRLGKAFTIAVPSDDKYLKAIESLIKAEIPRGEAPEGYEPSTADSRPDRAPRDDRKGRERGGRGRDRERPVKAHDEVAAMEPLVAAPKAEVAETQPEPRREERRDDRREPRADRGDRGDRGGDRRRDGRSEGRGEDRGERRDDRGERRDDRREPREERRDYRRDRDLGPSVIGMGDHVPDFILRSFALKATPVEEVEEAPATGTEG
ncbi:MAG TPA: DEAD/DEAH box helicase, partial [Tabrizicola sp.]